MPVFQCNDFVTTGYNVPAKKKRDNALAKKKRDIITTGNGSVAVCPHFAVSQNTGTRQQACLPCAEEAGTQ